MILLVFNSILFLTFFIKLTSLKLNCSVSTRPWRAGQSQTVFFMLTFLSLIGSFVYFIYIINAAPSKHLGPFQAEVYPYDIIGGDLIILQPGFAGCLLASLM